MAIDKPTKDRRRKPFNATPKEYRAWHAMKMRCLNPRVPTYYRWGGRGITICERWLHSFENFLSDMGEAPSPSHSLDRIDNDLGYLPDNCRWATQQEQARNGRHNHWIEYNGERKTIGEWAKQYGMRDAKLSRRLSRGWSVERALTAPNARKGSGHRLARLTAEQVSQIRELYSTGEYIQQELAEMFGVTQSAISCYVLWKSRT